MGKNKDGSKKRQIEIIWCVEDVQEVRPDLDEDQCMKVLMGILRRHDADLGVSWQTIEIYAEELFPGI